MEVSYGARERESHWEQKVVTHWQSRESLRSSSGGRGDCGHHVEYVVSPPGVEKRSPARGSRGPVAPVGAHD